LQEFGILNYRVPSAIAETDMSYWLVFIIGLTTSVHCIAMCGGINISQCLGRDDVNAGVVGGAALAQKNKSRLAVLWPSILYNGGRVASYTAIGFIVGAIGSVIEFSMAGQGVLKLIAGVFMVVMGLSMLNLFPQLRRFVPRMPKVFTNNKSKGPLAVGLLNGLMPCGPLQAMQIYALSTGSPFKGALSMMLFALGTAPLMFGLGTFSSAIGKKSSQKVMAAGAVMVAVLGLCMLSQSWNLFGAGGSALAAAATQQNSNSGSGGAGAKFNIDLGPQVINSTLQPFGYPSIKVEVGRPVRWVINAPPGSINGCNYRFVISEYGIRYEFKPGENVIEFMPTKTGNVPFTCWMGMMNGTITVEDQGSGSGETAPAAPRKGGGCCG
jgi:sulfite exporter TauE/SafE